MKSISIKTIVIFLTGLNILNYLDRYIISALGPSLQRDMGLTDAQLGALGSAFLWGFVLTSPFVGKALQWVSRRTILFSSVILWSVATAATGYFRLFSVMLLMRIIVGIAQAAFTNLSPTVVDDIVPQKWKARALALLLAAIPVGTAFGFIVGGYLDYQVGWRAAFALAGLSGVPFIVGYLFVPYVSQKRMHDTRSFFGDMVVLWKAKQYAWTVWGYTAQTFSLGGFAFWAPTYVERVLKFPSAQGSIIFGIILVATGFLGTLLGGWVTDRMPEKNRNKHILRMGVTLTAIAVPITVLMIYTTHPVIFFVCAALIETIIFMTFSPINAVFLSSVPHTLRATGIGVAMFVSRLVGDMFSIWLIGFISTLSSNLSFAMYSLAVVFVLNALCWQYGIRFKPMKS